MQVSIQIQMWLNLFTLTNLSFTKTRERGIRGSIFMLEKMSLRAVKQLAQNTEK